jgi:hypothetical protein
MTDIKKVLIKRAAYITLLFGLFGGALTLLLKIEVMQAYYPALASLIGLLVSLLVSFVIIGKRGTKIRNRFKIAAILLFMLFILCALLHTNLIITRTFEYNEFDETNRYVKGDYSERGLVEKKKYPMLTDEQLLYKKMGGVDGIEILYAKASVDQNIFLLIISYCGVVIFFVAAITFLTEVLAEVEGRKKRKTRRNAQAVT